MLIRVFLPSQSNLPWWGSQTKKNMYSMWLQYTSWTMCSVIKLNPVVIIWCSVCMAGFSNIQNALARVCGNGGCHRVPIKAHYGMMFVHRMFWVFGSAARFVDKNSTVKTEPLPFSISPFSAFLTACLHHYCSCMIWNVVKRLIKCFAIASQTLLFKWNINRAVVSRQVLHHSRTAHEKTLPICNE